MTAYFDLLDTSTMTCKVVADPGVGTSLLPLGEVMTVVSGKFPLNDYKDTINHSKHEYVLQRADGTFIRGILDGFTCDCTGETRARWPQGLGIPRFSLQLKPDTTTHSNDLPDSQKLAAKDPDSGNENTDVGGHSHYLSAHGNDRTGMVDGTTHQHE